MRRNKLQTSLLVVVLLLLGLVINQRQAIHDWIKLRGYQPSTAIATLASEDTMTPAAKHLFYINKPGITNSVAFAENCPKATEKTIILGCYRSGENGIFIYNVADPRLDGVQQVTAAHEMLHAAYERLSSKDRNYVDGLLKQFYKNDLRDQRLLDTIASYRQTEPNDVLDEMHSVFGTEVSNLPPQLEVYYQRYFGNRSKVAGFAAAYQAEFTSRQKQVEQYDVQLKSLRQQVDDSRSSLTSQKAALDDKASQMGADRASGDTDAYNSLVGSYNQAVDRYNTLVGQTKDQISQYNQLVEKRNAVALEEQQLMQAITASPETVKG
ncbi:MAG: hypothetical protein ABI220_01395 [Candidatus Saccharimonadales bacterium]